MNNPFFCRQLLCATLIAMGLLATAAPVVAARDEPALAEAMKRYQKGRLADAYGRFIQLANTRHRDAAPIALFMHRYGLKLYRTDWDASTEDIEYSSILAAQPPVTARAPIRR